MLQLSSELSQVILLSACVMSQIHELVAHDGSSQIMCVEILHFFIPLNDILHQMCYKCFSLLTLHHTAGEQTLEFIQNVWYLGELDYI